MNVVKIMGGLGNQLFQYAFGKVQMLNGIEVKFANSSYSEDKIRKQTWKREYRLDKYNTNITLSPFNPKYKTIRESSVGYSPNLLKMENYNFHGYWQYFNYYKDILPILKEEFVLKNSQNNADYLTILQKIQKDTASVSIHVRRGDYVLLPNSCIPPYDYFIRAMKQIEGNYYIFSEDIAWCKEKFKQKYFKGEINFVENLLDYLDFELIKNCKHNIISNSTFSWWAAILNPNDNKMVVAPSRWDMYKSTEMIYPKDWILC